MVIFHPLYVNSFFKLEIMYIKPGDPTTTLYLIVKKKDKFRVVGSLGPRIYVGLMWAALLYV